MSGSIPVTYSVTQTVNYNIISFEILTVSVQLYTSATVYLMLIDENGNNYPRCTTLTGDAYAAWAADDCYICTYIATNIQAIFEGS